MSIMIWRCAAVWGALMLSGPVVACSVSATSLNFGVIDPLADLAAASTSTVTVDCPSASSYTLSVSAGNGSYGQRYLSDGSHQLDYNLYKDNNHTQVVGDGSGVSTTLSGTGSPGSFTLYGYLPAQPAAVPGAYTDNLVVTVSY